MLMTKLKTIAGIFLVVGLVVAGAGVLAQQGPEAERQAAGAGAAPRMKYEIRIWKDGEATGKPLVVEEADGAELWITTPNERIVISPRPEPVPGPVTIGRVKPPGLGGQGPPEAVLVAPGPATEQEHRLAEVERKLDQLLLTQSPGRAKQGSGRATSLIPVGMRAFTIAMPSVASGVAGLILPGNRLDVLLTSQGKSGLLTTTLMQNVKILAVDSRIEALAESRVGPKLTSVTLLVTPEQATKLALGQSTGTLHLSLRGPEANQPADSSP
jgi:Flp pilus assembly protein RcpC/CpaB